MYQNFSCISDYYLQLFIIAPQLCCHYCICPIPNIRALSPSKSTIISLCLPPGLSNCVSSLNVAHSTVPHPASNLQSPSSPFLLTPLPRNMDKGLTEACFKHFLHHRGLASVPGTASPTKRQPPSQRLPDDAKPIPSKTMRITHRSSFQQTTSPKLHPLNKKRPDKSLSFQHLNSSRPQPRNSSSGFYTGHYDTSPLGKSSPRATGSSRSGREHPSAERSSRSDERQPRASSSKTDSHELKQFRCEYCAQIFGRKHHKERHVDNLHRKVGFQLVLPSSFFTFVR